MRTNAFWRAWARGVGILAYYICLSFAFVLIGGVTQFFPPIIGVPLFFLVGPPAVYWVSRWLAPDLIGAVQKMNR